MGWNNSRETWAFQRRMRLQQKQLEKAGTAEELSKELYDYDLYVKNRDRAYTEHNVSLNAIMEKGGFHDEWGMNPLLEKYREEFSTEMEIDHNSTFWWVNDLEDETLLAAVLSMTDRQRELISLLVFQGYTQKEVAQMWKVTQPLISYWWKAICQIVAEYRFGK